MYIRVCDYIFSDSCICVQESFNGLVVCVIYLYHTNPGLIISFALFFHFLRKNKWDDVAISDILTRVRSFPLHCFFIFYEKINKMTWQFRTLWLDDFLCLYGHFKKSLYLPFSIVIILFQESCSEEGCWIAQSGSE